MTAKTVVGKNIKVVAQGFAPSLFTEYYLKKESFITEDIEILPNAISTPHFVQLNAKKFNLVVLPDQLQFNIHDGSKIGANFIKTLVEKILNLRYLAMGFNFDYFVPATEIKADFFFVPSNKLFHEFHVPNAKYGTFLSKDFIDSRLSVSVRPLKAKSPIAVESDVYHFNMNYHFELKNVDFKSIINRSLDNWETYNKYSEELLSF